MRGKSGGALGESGFTLIEMLVSTMIGLLVIGTFLGFSRFQLFAMQDQSKQLDLQTTVRNTAQLFADEVRRAGSDPLCTKAFDGIVTASGWHIYLRSDLDGSGTIGGQGEDVLYFFVDDGDTIYRYSQGQVETLISGVDISGSRIRYFDAAGAEIDNSSALDAAERAAIRRVRLELNVADDARNPQRDQPLRTATATNIDLRNRFFLKGTGCP